MSGRIVKTSIPDIGVRGVLTTACGATRTLTIHGAPPSVLVVPTTFPPVDPATLGAAPDKGERRFRLVDVDYELDLVDSWHRFLVAAHYREIR